MTDVSGRGVGMDVVKKNITALGGTVEIDSAEGYGMSVRVRLPLTLAIMDGMSVGVGDECYILPLGSVVESLPGRADTIRTIGGQRPRRRRCATSTCPSSTWSRSSTCRASTSSMAGNIMVVVEAEGGRVALLRRRTARPAAGRGEEPREPTTAGSTDVSGATIMGDGRVALILDIGALVRRSRG